LVVSIWISLGWSAHMYEIVPGFIAGALAIWIVSKLTQPPSAEIIAQFNAAAEAAKVAR
jgi:fructose-specific phosphotransferase system IIC component